MEKLFHSLITRKCGLRKVNFVFTYIPVKSKNRTFCYTDIPEDKDALSVASVFKFFLPRDKEWFQVGLELGLTTKVLQTISGQYREKPDVALMKTVKYWYISTPNPTWESVGNGN